DNPPASDPRATSSVPAPMSRSSSTSVRLPPTRISSSAGAPTKSTMLSATSTTSPPLSASTTIVEYWARMFEWYAAIRRQELQRIGGPKPNESVSSDESSVTDVPWSANTTLVTTRRSSVAAPAYTFTTP